MTDEAFPRLLAALGYLSLRRDGEGGFVVVGDRPAWYLRLFPDRVTEQVVPVEECFPFLSTFLPTAETFWGSRGQGRNRSGYWVERYASGQEVPLQASALCLDEDDYLLVEYVKSVYEEQKGMLQKARDQALDRESP